MLSARDGNLWCGASRNRRPTIRHSNQFEQTLKAVAHSSTVAFLSEGQRTPRLRRAPVGGAPPTRSSAATARRTDPNREICFFTATAIFIGRREHDQLHGAPRGEPVRHCEALRHDVAGTGTHQRRASSQPDQGRTENQAAGPPPSAARSSRSPARTRRDAPAPAPADTEPSFMGRAEQGASEIWQSIRAAYDRLTKPAAPRRPTARQRPPASARQCLPRAARRSRWRAT